MSRSHSLLRFAIIAAAISAPLTVAMAKDPVKNVGKRHPNLAAALDADLQAYGRIEKAQVANEFDLGGHAHRAKEALKVAADELKLAAQTSNAR